MDVSVDGNINGVNMKDTKLISTNCKLVTSGVESTVRVRRLRNDDCEIKTVNGNVSVGSYIETGKL